jgi:predicted metalloprotease with PDZ domain
VIQPFNFMTPTPSEHIWLYEGVTEWVSEIMQLRSSQIAPGEFMDRISSKMTKAGRYEERYSLSAMSLECYTPRGQQAFPNYYQLGSLTATLLDLRLLELSAGKKGLRELFLELVHDYGKDNPFPEEDFFDTLVAHSYPEIRSFIDRYIRDSQPLPFAEYFEKIGFRYIPQKPSSSKRATMDAGITLNENKEFIAVGVGLQAKESGLRNGDIYLKLNGEAITLDNARDLGMKTMQNPVGTGITIVVRRDGKEITIQSKMFPRMDYHIFEEIEYLTPEQQAFRKAWSSYL